jgi:hypothetical protein
LQGEPLHVSPPTGHTPTAPWSIADEEAPARKRKKVERMPGRFDEEEPWEEEEEEEEEDDDDDEDYED